MKLVRFSTGGGAPRLGAAVGPWDRWDWGVDLAAVALTPPEWYVLPAYYNGNPLNIIGTEEAIAPMRFETFEGKTPRLVLSTKMDYEAEIGFVLGLGGRDIEAT